MAVGRVLVVCGIIAGILAWFATRKDIFTVKNETFIARDANDVYQVISDLRKHTKYHSHVPKDITLVQTKFSADGVEERLFHVKEYVPLPLDYNLTVSFDALTQLTKPNKELVIDIDVMGGVSGTSTWSLLPSSTGGLRGTLVTEVFTLKCPRVTCWFIEQKAAVSHEELFQNLKKDLESSGI